MLFNRIVESILDKNLYEQEVVLPLNKIISIYTSAFRVIFDLDEGDIFIENSDPHIMTRPPTQSFEYPMVEVSKFDVQNWKGLFTFKYKKKRGGHIIVKVNIGFEQKFTSIDQKERWIKNLGTDYVARHTFISTSAEIKRDKNNFILFKPTDVIGCIKGIESIDGHVLGHFRDLGGLGYLTMGGDAKRFVDEVKRVVDRFLGDDRDRGGDRPEVPTPPRPTKGKKPKTPELVPA
jgi:hypothetical protein